MKCLHSNRGGFQALGNEKCLFAGSTQSDGGALRHGCNGTVPASGNAKSAWRPESRDRAVTRTRVAMNGFPWASKLTHKQVRGRDSLP